MLTQENIKALRLWQAAEGKEFVTPTGARRKPTSSERRHAQFALAESISSGEFPTQILPAVRRTLTARFDRTPRVHQLFTTRKTVEAINVAEEVNTYTFGDQTNLAGSTGNGMVLNGDSFIAGGLPTILPRQPYPQIGLTGAGKEIIARKIGEAFAMDWEAIVRSRGSRVNLIRDGFEAFGQHAANQEEIDVARLFVKSSGFATGTGEGLDNAQAISGNPDLYDPDDIATALGTLMNTEVEGQIPSYGRFVILTPIANAPLIQRAVGARRFVRNPGATSGYSWEETVDFGAQIEVIGWKWLTAIWGAMGKGAIIVPVPDDTELPVFTSNYLEGYETPSLWIKDSNARNIGGGEVNPEVDGDFDSDAVVTKVRHVHGANALWTEAVGFTTGANS
jgi:hypothetical protein